MNEWRSTGLAVTRMVATCPYCEQKFVISGDADDQFEEAKAHIDECRRNRVQ